MPSFTIHLVVPVLALLALRFTPRRVLLLAPFALLPDLDYFMLPGMPDGWWVHRASLHNLFLVAIPFILLALSERTGRMRDHRESFLIAGIYLASHVLMDAFVGGVLPLWPILNWTARFNLSILVDTQTNEPRFHGRADAFEGAPEVAPVYPWLSSTETGILVFVSLVYLASAVGAFRRRARVPEDHDDDAPRSR